jgi:hypothetical protein
MIITQEFQPSAGVRPTPFSSRFSGTIGEETLEEAAPNTANRCPNMVMYQ